ncbi:MAG TPA: PAS domain S-box protein [Armatimonadota bacterium]|jgi:PAS domain S-box-containing protein
MRLHKVPSRAWLRWILAVLIPAIAIALRADPLSAVADRSPYVTFYPAVLLTALYGGVYPGALATAICAAAATLWTSPVGRVIGFRDHNDILGLAVFAVSCLLISWVCEAMHRSSLRAQNATAQLMVAEERRRANEARERYELLARHSRDIILFVRREDGRIVDCNEAAERAYGWGRKELCSLTIHDLRLPDDRHLIERQIDVADAEGALFETFHKRKDGTTFPVEVSASGSTMGGERYVFSVIRDITRRKRAEDALREAEANVRAILDAAAESIYLFSVDGIILSANQTAARRIQKTPKEIIGRPFTDFVSEDLAEKRWIPLRQVAATGLPVQFEDEREGIVFDHTFYPVFDEGGAVHRIASFSRDITELTAAEAKVRDSERLYRAIGESIDYGVWVCEPDGRNIYASESFLNLVGMTQEQCSNFGWGDVLHPDDSERTIAAWKECVQTGATWDTEHRYRGVDGQWHAILARGVPVRNERGEVICWAGINLDISRMKQAEDEARQANRAKDQFLAMLAHELRNLLAPISSSAALIEMLEAETEAVREPLGILNRQVRHTARLLDDLLDMSRINHGKLELRMEPVDLGAALLKAAETARPQMCAMRHTFSTRLPNAPVWVFADPTRVEQIVGNLLHNAAKYTDPGGEVTLELSVDGEQAAIRVRDNGSGIEPEMLSRVFDLFTQEERSQDRSRGGVGIGLSLVKTLVEMHGGSVEALSNGPGSGSEFIVRLGVHDPGATAPLPARSRAGTRASNILVVDDNVDAAESLAAVLEAWGHNVDFVHDGTAAIEAVRRNRPEVVLLDIGLPGMDGYEVARRLQLEDGAPMRLIALTGYSPEKDCSQSRDAGFDELLIKPVDLEALSRVLDQGPPAAEPQRP